MAKVRCVCWFLLAMLLPYAAASAQPGTGQIVSLNLPGERDRARALEFSRDGTLLMTLHQENDALSFFDAATRTYLGSTPVGDNPQGMATTPDGLYVLVANFGSGTMSIVSIATRAVVATVPVQAARPYDIRVTANGARAVVAALTASTGSAAQFTVVNLGTRTVERVISIGSVSWDSGDSWSYPKTQNRFYPFYLSPSGSEIYWPDLRGQRFYIYSVTTGAQLASILLSYSDMTISDVNPTGTLALVAGGGNRYLYVIDIPGHRVKFGTYDPVSQCYAARFTPTGNTILASIGSETRVLDTTTGAKLAGIPMSSWVMDYKFTSDGAYAIAFEGIGNSSTPVINLATRTVSASQPLGIAKFCAISPVGSRAALLQVSSNFREEILTCSVNGSAPVLEGVSPAGPSPEVDTPSGVAISPDGRTAVVTNYDSDNVSIIDMASGAVRSTVAVGKQCSRLAITPDSSRALVCNKGSNSVSVIDLGSDTVTSTLSLSSAPLNVLISSDGAFAYVVAQSPGMVHKLDLAGTPSIVATHTAGSPYPPGGGGARLSPDGHLLGVCSANTNQLILIDPATMQTIATPTVDNSPTQVVFNSTGTRAYVSSMGYQSVSVVNVAGAASSMIAKASPVASPNNLVIDREDRYVYASGTQGVHVIDTVSNILVKTLTLPGGQTQEIQYDPSCDILYVTARSTNGYDAAVTGDRLYRVRAAGQSTNTIDYLTATGSRLDQAAYSRKRHTLVASMPLIDSAFIATYPPNADVTADGDVTLEDFFGFFNDFDSTLPAADLNGDGEVDLVDFFAFFNAFDLGCP